MWICSENKFLFQLGGVGHVANSTPWSVLTEQIDAGLRNATVRAFVAELWVAAPATLLVFVSSVPPQCGAYVLLAHDRCPLYAGSADGCGGMRRRLGEHLAPPCARRRTD
jgi:hypothetical protein